MRPRRTGTQIAVLVLAITLTLSACAAENGKGEPTDTVSRFYGAALRGDSLSAAEELVRSEKPKTGAILASVSRGRTLARVEWVSTNVWSEHGAQIVVRRTFKDGSSDEARVEVKRERGKWRVAKAE
jgi:hypothetical protein